MGGLHTGKLNEVMEVEVVCTVTIPPVAGLVNPLNQGKCTGIGTRVHARAVGSTAVGHVRHARNHMGTKGPRDEITRSIITRHEEKLEVRDEGWEPCLFPPSLLSLSDAPVRSLCHWLPSQAFLPLVVDLPLPIIRTVLRHLVVML